MYNFLNMIRPIELERLPFSRPISDRIEVATRVHNACRRHNFLIFGIPCIGDWRNVARAHNALSKHIDAVIYMSR
jgi:hypothetical protein